MISNLNNKVDSKLEHKPILLKDSKKSNYFSNLKKELYKYIFFGTLITISLLCYVAHWYYCEEAAKFLDQYMGPYRAGSISLGFIVFLTLLVRLVYFSVWGSLCNTLKPPQHIIGNVLGSYSPRDIFTFILLRPDTFCISILAPVIEEGASLVIVYLLKSIMDQKIYRGLNEQAYKNTVQIYVGRTRVIQGVYETIKYVRESNALFKPLLDAGVISLKQYAWALIFRIFMRILLCGFHWFQGYYISDLMLNSSIEYRYFINVLRHMSWNLIGGTVIDLTGLNIIFSINLSIAQQFFLTNIAGVIVQ